MTKVCVTGVAGFIGSHIAENLLKDGHEVIGIDLAGCETPQNIPKGVEYWPADIRWPSIQKPLEGCEVVYHCAAYAAEILSLFKPIYVNDVNVQGSLNVITTAVKVGVKTFLFTSSNSIYGYQEEVPYPENVEKKPQDIYGIGKLCTEMQLKNMAEVHGMNYIVIRPFNVYGPHQNIGDPYRNVLGIWFNRILNKKKPIVYGDGKQERAFTYIDDFAPVISRIPFINKALNQTFNIGTNEFITLEEAANIVCDSMDFKLGYDFADARPQEVKISYPSCKKAENILGYKTKTSFKEGIKKMAEWVKTQEPREFTYWPDDTIEIWNKMPKVWRDKLL